MDVDILLYQPTWRKKGRISFNKGSKRKTWGGKKKINKFFHEVTRDYYYCLDGDSFATQLVRCSRRIYYSMYLMCLGMLINCPGFLMNSTCSLVGLQTYIQCVARITGLLKYQLVKLNVTHPLKYCLNSLLIPLYSLWSITVQSRRPRSPHGIVNWQVLQ